MKTNFNKITSSTQNSIKNIIDFLLFIFTKAGSKILINSLKKRLIRLNIIPEVKLDYNQWITNQSNAALKRIEINNSIELLIYKPLISINLTLDESNYEYLPQTLDSIFAQIYNNYEVCITGNTNILNQAEQQLNSYKTFTEKIKIKQCSNNLLNSCLLLSDGTYILFLDTGATITQNCLFEFVKFIDAHTDCALVYTDEDLVNSDGKYYNPFFKPDWAPDSLLSRNYIGNNFFVNSDIVKKLSGFINEIIGSEKYDFILRVSEIAKIGHIAKVLIHKQFNIDQPNNLFAKTVLQNTLNRRKILGIVKELDLRSNCFIIDYTILKPEKVSIIIPSKDNTALLKIAIDSILQKTDYPDYEIIIINNNSVTKEFFQFTKEYENKYSNIIRLLDADFPFNFSKLMNFGVANCNGAYILMLNNDVEVINQDWMSKMVSYAQRASIGSVGANLLYPDETLQHAGIALGIGEATSHLFVNSERNAEIHHNFINTVNNYSALTAACLMCKKSTYNEVGGMDEQLDIEYNDVDFCLKLLDKGLYNVYLPNVELFHYESATRGHPFKSKESWDKHVQNLKYFSSKWQKKIENDTFWNKNNHLNFKFD